MIDGTTLFTPICCPPIVEMNSSLQTTLELEQRKPKMAVLPIGATEQHSAHLPVATDSIIVEAVAWRVADRLDAYCLPALPFSISHMHRGSRGTVWLRNQTFPILIRDIAVSLRHDGFKHLVLLNGHGGNFVLLPIVQDLNLEFPDLLTLTLKPSDFIGESGIFKHKASWRHADEFETACMMYLRPELVHRRKLRDQISEPDRELLRYLPFAKFTRVTHTGRPTLATPEKGQRAIEFIVKRTVESILATLRKVGRNRKAGE
jgi:creatinine amidohydrolase